jgi:uridine kinase
LSGPPALIDFDAAVATVGRHPGARLVAIDGLPASGKSTLAARLETGLGATVVHLDDFVRPEGEWRGRAVPAFPFPYIRYGEFLAAVTALAHGEPARYRPYNWATGRLGDERETHPDGLVVVEGVSSLHPRLAPLYDLRFWVESDEATVLEASLARGVGAWEEQWRTLFLPSVALYLETSPKDRADILVAGRAAAARA